MFFYNYLIFFCIFSFTSHFLFCRFLSIGISFCFLGLLLGSFPCLSNSDVLIFVLYYFILLVSLRGLCLSLSPLSLSYTHTNMDTYVLPAYKHHKEKAACIHIQITQSNTHICIHKIWV